MGATYRRPLTQKLFASNEKNLQLYYSRAWNGKKVNLILTMISNFNSKVPSLISSRTREKVTHCGSKNAPEEPKNGRKIQLSLAHTRQYTLPHTTTKRILAYLPFKQIMIPCSNSVVVSPLFTRLLLKKKN